MAEIIDSELHLSPRASLAQNAVAFGLAGELGAPLRRSWRTLRQPELHLGADIVVPDVAGWRRERVSAIGDEAFSTIAPDWLCEVLSPGTQKLDRAEKLRLYARAGVRHVWLIDPRDRTLEVLRRQDAMWLVVAVHRDGARVRAEPFEAIELDLAVLWADLAPAP